MTSQTPRPPLCIAKVCRENPPFMLKGKKLKKLSDVPQISDYGDFFTENQLYETRFFRYGNIVGATLEMKP
jgi:hypothetical protein